MANRFFTPYEQFADATGLPYANGNLYFYASGTSTPLTTYSDRALTVPNANPVPLDASGKPAVAIFLQNLAYKVVLLDANSNPVWTADPVYSSDFSAVAQFQSISGSPNGVLAGSAGSATIPASSCWDYTNSILYVCTQTGTSSTAVWTAINAATTAAVVPPPQGYLTLTSGTPVIPSDVTAASTVYYTPFVGNIIPIYNGTSFNPTVFTEVQCALVAAHAANNIYDLFVFNNSGVLTLVTGPAWSSSAAGSGSRGTGAGTTQITRVNGLWVNSVSMTGRNGSTTYTVPANQGTYVGSIYIDATLGQVSCYRTAGQSRKWGVFNAYNRTPVMLQVTDSTASWSTTTAAPTFRAANGSTANSFTSFFGLQEEQIDSEYQVWMDAGGAGRAGYCGIGFNTTTAASGSVGNGLTASAGWFRGTIKGNYIASPSLGINVFTAVESCDTGCTFQGTLAGGKGMLMKAFFRA